MEYELVNFFYNDIQIEVRVSSLEETVWLSLNDMCTLFGKTKSAISRYLKRFKEENKQQIGLTVANLETVQIEGNRQVTRQIDYYNLDVICHIGYCLKSPAISIFKKWSEDSISAIKTQKMLNKSNIIKFDDGRISLDVKVNPDEFTVYLTKDQMSLLFNRDRSVITRHINNIFKENELDEKNSCAKNAHKIGNQIYYTDYYTLDVVISVGFRVKSENGITFRKWALSILKEYLLKGYVINDNRTLVTNENYINLINKVDSIGNRVAKLEEDNGRFPKNVVFYENTMFDALIFISELIGTANKSIVLIDPFVDVRTLSCLRYKNDNVSITLIKTNKAKLLETDIKKFESEYGPLIIKIDESYHDRYLVIDDLVFYHLGSSINYLGSKFSQITKIEDRDIIKILRKRINEQK